MQTDHMLHRNIGGDKKRQQEQQLPKARINGRNKAKGMK